MARVTRPGGLVAACVWDHAPGGGGPLTTFWRAVHDLDPDAHDESDRPGTREGHLAELAEAAGLSDIRATTITVSVTFESFSDCWDPYTMGVGPAGAYVARLDDGGREVLRDRCARLLPSGRFEVEASAWCVSAEI